VTSDLNQTLVSIIVPNWNSKDLLRACLKSIVNLTYPNYEIIVVDNASADGSPEMVKTEFPNVKIIANERNLGFAAGCNVGIKSAKGEMIALFNNDAVADPSWLTELVNTISYSSDIGIVGGVILYYKPKGIIWSAGGRIDAITGTSWRIAYGKPIGELGNVEDVDYICGCALLIRREVIAKIGLLNEDYFMYREDVDWNLRAKRAGYKCTISPSGVVWHKVPFKRNTPLAAYSHYATGIFRLYLEHFPARYLFTALLFQSVIVPIFEILLFRRPVSFAASRLRGLFKNLLGLRKIIAKRRKNELLGELPAKARVRECLAIAKEAKTSGRRPLA